MNIPDGLRWRRLGSTAARRAGSSPAPCTIKVQYLAERADALELTYAVEHEPRRTSAVTSLVTALAMNWLQSGKYVP